MNLTNNNDKKLNPEKQSHTLKQNNKTTEEPEPKNTASHQQGTCLLIAVEAAERNE